MEIETSGLEVLLKEIPYNEIGIGYKTHNKHYYDEWSMELLCRYGRKLFTNYSEDEINNVFEYLKFFNCKKDEKNSIFQLIQSVSKEVLSREKTIQYKYKSTLRWRNLSLYIGADIFVASHIAEVKDRTQRLQRIYNCWKPSITVEENYRVKDKLAENHFHLIGSTRIFELNWIAVMNYVLDRETDFNKIFEYRKPLRIFSEHQNLKVSLWKKTCLAALYRLYLFCVINQYELRYECEKMIIAVENNEQLEVLIPKLDQMIENVRIYYCNNELGKIDYAISKEVFLCNVDSAYSVKKDTDDIIVVSPQTESWIALAGERTFLVECLSKIYSSSEFKDFEKNIFYRYLVIKNNFRDELIQVNKEIGFSNFSEYQKRKTYFVKNRSFYVNEIGRLALSATVDSQNLDSFESRIMVAEKDYLFNTIMRYNDIFYNRKNAMDKDEVDLFYVLHFPKQKEASVIKFEPRNYKVRKNVEKKARELVNFLMQHPECVYFVRGIDTCSNEIGCRPEVFAVIYRQLMNHPFKGYKQIWKSDRLSGEILNNNKKQVCENILEEYDCYLQATYHVGEEFIDIVDGLRAIEEAVLFCNLNRGCRLGHALALGIDPKTYYKFKKSEIVLSRQDLLDNLMWLYYKGKKYRMDKIERFQKLFEVLPREILEQLQYIYGDNVTVDEMNKYYIAWMLRGDNPDMYRTVQCIDIEKYRGTPFEYNYNYQVDQVEITATVDNSNNKEKNKNEQLLHIHIRNDEDVIRWYHRYHYDMEAREKGKECCKYKIPRGYASLVQLIQDEIMKEIQELGIAIECNPSSNCLIGTFGRYDEHPIVRFNSQSLQPSPYSHRLMVSINTDDQGVFDTSLENEYYIVKVALDKAIDQDEQKVYFNEEEWIANVIKMGHEQAFTFDKMIRN